MSKFKEGELVQVLRDCEDNKDITEGMAGNVVKYGHGKEDVLVKFPYLTSGHNGEDQRSSDRNCWWMDPDDLVPLYEVLYPKKKSGRDEKSTGDFFKGMGYKLQGSGVLDKQVGGDHYKDAAIQPITYITANNLNFLEGCVVKRVTRWRVDGGKGVEDLKKAIHEIELLIHFHENDKAGDDNGN